MIRANDFGKSRPTECMGIDWGGGDYNIGANQAGKRACSLLNCISVMNDTETNEQIVTGLLYAHSEFDALMRGEMLNSNLLD